MENIDLGLNLEFQYDFRVYYIDTHKRTLGMEHYSDIVIKIPKRILLPNRTSIQDYYGNSLYEKQNSLEYMLSMDNERYKDLQGFIKSIDWGKEREKISIKHKLEVFIDEYGEDELRNVINQLNVQFKYI